MQTAAIEKMADARGDIVATWYAEKCSARTMERAELARLRADLKAGRLAGRRCYVFRLDRLSRSGIRDTFELIEELRAHNCELVSVSDGFDLNGPTSEVILAVMAWASKMERLAINERITAARDRVEAEGRHWGRPRRMSDQQITRAQRMKRQGLSVRSISVALKVPRATVARAIADVSRTGGAT